MKLSAIFLAICVLFSLLPSHLSLGLYLSPEIFYSFACTTPVYPNQLGLTHFYIYFVDELGEPSLIATEKRQWCPFKKQMFRGSCSKDGGQQCLNDLLRTWDPSVRLSPVYCNCTTKPNNKRLCSCPNMICP
ncbi:hypothetical protein EUTSA_v10024049mg [Eutrema salsugineum]|uniref:S-locus glycoprotein domain-containing protein n=1 Tax=Eutrema salsugineum TaxID=72664 RepID=V4KHL9_EUTSA|nr:defensin-like protein 249 [Eutrema salsugineum]ESQ29357.1 hypothetical protein EUTSA_v10024049mg [Eutrema salsugineum]